MTNIYTKTGDSGKTGLFGGTRIEKDDLNVDCYGTIDEVNSVLGVAYSLVRVDDIKKELRHIQEKLFVLGAELASDNNGKKLLQERITDLDVKQLERLIDKYSSKIGKQNGFIIPGRTTASAVLHVARTIVRRAERLIVSLKKSSDISTSILKFVNRLSDLLFVLANVEEEFSVLEEIKSKVLEELKIRVSKENLTLEAAKKMARAAENKAMELGVSIVYSVVDAGGNLILLHRMDDSLIASIDISINKAYTSLALKMPTDKVALLAQPGKELYGIQMTNNNRIVLIGGGYPLRVNDRVIGAIGVSGGTVEEDIEIALHSLRVFELERR